MIKSKERRTKIGRETQIWWLSKSATSSKIERVCLKSSERECLKSSESESFKSMRVRVSELQIEWISEQERERESELWKSASESERERHFEMDGVLNGVNKLTQAVPFY